MQGQQRSWKNFNSYMQGVYIIWHGQWFLSILFPVCRLRKYCPPCSFPYGLRSIAPNVLGSMELLCFACVCTYVPNSTLQCLSYIILFPVIIALGLIVGCTPSLCGKLFSQNTQLYTISTFNSGRYCLNGSVVEILLTLSLPVLMYLSIPSRVHLQCICLA